MISPALTAPPSLLLGELSVPTNVFFVRAVLAYVSQIGQMLAFDEKENNALQLAIDEAFCNAVTHYGTTGSGAETIHVDFSLHDWTLVVSIREQGIPFDPTKPMPFSTDSLDAALKPGIGMRLMQSCVDKVEFLTHGRDGKEVRLSKRLSSHELPGELFATTARRERITVKVPEVRLLTAADVPAVSKLAWRCYGYSHEAALYDRDKLTHDFEAGRYVPIAAFDPATGEMFGHECLKFHDLEVKVPELGLAFVDSLYRCAGASVQMARDLISLARERGCLGVYDRSVTTHTMSQRQLQEHVGSVPCSMSMGIAPRGMRLKELANSIQTKGSVINHYFAIDRAPATVYVPTKHLEMVREIYQWLDLPRTFASPSGETPVGESTVEVEHTAIEWNVSMITVRRIGADCVEQIRQSMTNCRLACKDGVFVYLSLQTPFAPAMIEECEKLGLSFAGIMPHIHFGEDRILLQSVNVPLDMESIHVHGERSRKLFAYIRTCLGPE